ncbi:MAG: transporter [Sphingomonas bacterium]|uniref:spinster family MFS transporter n=1 Tax=Sphingomonas bacterium TaxID=1895847 RepID=UPI0026361741|nr:MFS transporter [Sphingomonas bacterium]MDB5696975.1 transporter [Sphingomonas bacterium]
MQPIVPADPIEAVAEPHASGAAARTTSSSAAKLTPSWLVLTLLMLSYAVNFADRTIINVLGEAIKRDLQLSDTQLGLLGGLSFALLYAVMSVPIARLSDRYSRVRILSTAIAFWSAATMLCAAATSYVHLLVMRVFVGIGESGCSPSAQSLITDYFPRAKRAFAISIYYIGVPLGSFGGAMFAGALAEDYGWRVAFLVVGAPGILLALVLLLLMREPPRGRFDAIEADSEAPPFSAVLRTLWSTPGLRNVAAGTTLAAFTAYSIGAFLHPLFVRDFKMDYSEAAFTYGVVNAGAAAVGTFIGGWLTDVLTRRDYRWIAWLPALGLAIGIPLHVGGVLQSSLTVLVVCMFVSSFAGAFYHGPTFASIHNRIAPRMRATATAILMLLSASIGLGMGPLLTGFASDSFAAAAFTGLDYAGECVRRGMLAAATSEVRAACGAASAEGVRYAIALVSLVNIVAVWNYMIAARRLSREEDGVELHGG